jgi:hypothetical protein
VSDDAGTGDRRYLTGVRHAVAPDAHEHRLLHGWVKPRISMAAL